MSTLGMRSIKVLKKEASEAASHTFHPSRYWEEPLVPDRVPKAQPWEQQAKSLRDVKGKVVSRASTLGQEDEQNEEEEEETKPTHGLRHTTRPLPQGTPTDPLGESPGPSTASQTAKTPGKPERDSPRPPKKETNKKEPSSPDYLKFWTWKWSGPHPYLSSPSHHP
ncbi:hypothetical protein DID88_007032 [Monilinia fructigena]|uniref:Uncharacterized protein n=1 Tax=Monilinia fructigena TaxID=38457 RepID=A0A395J729_9HELO|nr:hypothetical protein DID88_007032 [Monilinia fructigena]